MEEKKSIYQFIAEQIDNKLTESERARKNEECQLEIIREKYAELEKTNKDLAEKYENLKETMKTSIMILEDLLMSSDGLDETKKNVIVDHVERLKNVLR